LSFVIDERLRREHDNPSILSPQLRLPSTRLPKPIMYHHEPSSRAMLPTLIEYRAKNDSDRPFAVFPAQDDEAPSQITFAEFQQACSRFGRAVYPEAPAKEGYVVGIVATTDTLTYLAAIGGIIFAGLTVRVIL
jgi:acyl-CoA synthetase (AMP-forming)/AMP-acid ligase II